MKRGQGIRMVRAERCNLLVAHLLEEPGGFRILSAFHVRQGEVVERGQGLRVIRATMGDVKVSRSL